jgi:pimeloyl-ACP methyl ester carboxylesterase
MQMIAGEFFFNLRAFKKHCFRPTAINKIILLFISFVFINVALSQDIKETILAADTSFTAGKYYTSHDNTKIYYEVVGQGEPVVLIPGFMNTSENWKRAQLYHDLVDAGYKVVTVDLRGNGKSDKPHSLKAYQDDAEAKDIMGLMKMLRLKKYTVIGYSRGAIIASRVLVKSKRAKAAVIGGMGTGFMDTAWARRKMFYRALSGEPVKELEGVLDYIKKNHLDQVALAYSQGGQPSTSAKEFARIKKPVLVICGDKDSDHAEAEKLSSMIPRSVFTTVPGDHNNAMKTQEFSTAVMTFMKKDE